MTKVQVLTPFKIRTKQGEMELKEGDLLKVDDSSAIRLIGEKKVKKVKIPPCRIYSKLLGEEIWVVADQEDMESLVSRGIQQAVYVGWEIALLKMESREMQEAAHRIKKAFPGSIITPSSIRKDFSGGNHPFEMWLEENGKITVLHPR